MTAFRRRDLLRTGLALFAASALPGCIGWRGDHDCVYGWFSGPSDACYDHSFRPGGEVMRGTARSGEDEFDVRNRLADEAQLTPEQTALLFNLLRMEVNGETPDFQNRHGYRFNEGDEVVFYLIEFVAVVDPYGDLNQLDLFDDAYVVPNDQEVIDRVDNPDGHGLGFIVIRNGIVYQPTEHEFELDEDGLWAFQPLPGDRVVYLEMEYMSEAA